MAEERQGKASLAMVMMTLVAVVVASRLQINHYTKEAPRIMQERGREKLGRGAVGQGEEDSRDDINRNPSNLNCNCGDGDGDGGRQTKGRNITS